MDLASIIAIAISNNIDTFGVSTAYVIKGIKITADKNLWISVISFIISSIAVVFGNLVSSFFSNEISKVISMTIFIVIGVFIIIEPYIKKLKIIKKNKSKTHKSNIIKEILDNPEKGDIDNSKSINFKEATLFGIALTINNIGGGISAGIAYLNPILVGLLSAIISFVIIASGSLISKLFKNNSVLSNNASLISGLLLILIGIKQII